MLTIAAHHLRRLLKNPGLVLILAAIPVTLALIEYAAFGPTVAAGRLPPIKVLLLDEDRSVVSGVIPRFFVQGPMHETFVVSTVRDRAEARRLFERNEASALIVVPEGFQATLLDGRRSALILHKNPIQTFLPNAAESVLVMATAIGNGVYAQAGGPLAQIRERRAANRWPTEAQFAEVATGVNRTFQRMDRIASIGDLDLRVERPSAPSATVPRGDPARFFAHLFPGLVLFGLMFIGQALAARLLRDRTRGLERRLVMTGIPQGAVSLGSMLYLVVALFFLLLLLGLIGGLLFRVTMRAPGGLVVLGLGFAAFAAGLHLAINGMARSDRGAQSMSSVVVLLLSLLGGSFVPVESYPPFLQKIAVIVPNGAAQQGLIDLLVRGRAFGDILSRAAIVWGFGLLLLLMAFVAERRRLVQ